MASINLIIFSIFFVVLLNIYYNSSGIYSKELNLIVLFPKDYPVTSEFHIAAHEIAHYTYFTKLTSEKRLEYEQLFNDSNEFISGYSKTNAAENFAEEFAYATICKMNPEYVTNSRLNFFINNYEMIINGDEDK